MPKRQSRSPTADLTDAQLMTVVERAERDAELTARIASQMELSSDRRKALDYLAYTAHLAERAGKLDDAQRELLRILEAVRRPRTAAAPLTPPLRQLATARETSYFWLEVGRLLDAEPDVKAAVETHRSELAERGIAADAYTLPLLAYRLLELEQDGVLPEGELSRALRRTWNLIGTGSIPEPPAPVLDPLAASAAGVAALTGAHDPFARGDALAREEGALAVERAAPQVTVTRVIDADDPASAPESVTGYGVAVR
jgi:hypothetical protein